MHQATAPRRSFIDGPGTLFPYFPDGTSIVYDGGAGIGTPVVRECNCSWWQICKLAQDSRFPKMLMNNQSVPPVWEGLKMAWVWMDNKAVSPEVSDFDDDSPIGIRKAWWEDMIGFIIDEVGWMSLT